MRTSLLLQSFNQERDDTYRVGGWRSWKDLDPDLSYGMPTLPVSAQTIRNLFFVELIVVHRTAACLIWLFKSGQTLKWTSLIIHSSYRNLLLGWWIGKIIKFSACFWNLLGVGSKSKFGGWLLGEQPSGKGVATYEYLRLDGSILCSSLILLMLGRR